MNLKPVFLATVLGTLATLSANAQLFEREDRTLLAPASFYRVQELSFDFFGNVSVAERAGHHAWRDGRLGTGAGVNYFHRHYYGLGADIYWGRLGAPDQMSLSGIFRYPLDPTNFSPYLFGGGARHWNPVIQWSAHVGGGLEYRWHDHIGTFVDGRYNFAERTSHFGVFRLGMRFAF